MCKKEQNNFHGLLLEKINKHKDGKIVFWGASLFLEEFLKTYDLNNCNILGIIDRNPKKRGQELKSIKFIRPRSLST